MTRARLLALAERRARLSVRASAEREAIAALVSRGDGLARSGAGALAKIRVLLRELRARPLLAAAGIALLAAWRPRRALGWALKAWSLWRMVRSAQRWWLRIAALAAAPAGR